MNYFEFGENQTLFCLLIGAPWRALDSPVNEPWVVRWHLKIFASEKSRHIGILRQQREYPSEMLYTFQVSLKELLSKSNIVPMIAGDKKVDERRLSQLRPRFKKKPD